MNAPEDGGLHSALAWVQAGVAAFKQTWEAFILPGILGWWSWRRWSADRTDKRAQEGRTDQEKREAAFVARFDRLDARDQEAFRRGEAERDRANADRDAAERRADAAERERWRMELWARDYEHALGDARRAADDARAKASLPPAEWKPVPRPTLPGDPA